MQVGDLVKYYRGLMHPEAESLQLGIVVGIDDDGTVMVKWPGNPPEHELEFVLEVVNANR
tara:strand:+ start:264 stop:443 length:180 start_codon:yes stop_codon:yes gene_type:complete